MIAIWLFSAILGACTGVAAGKWFIMDRYKFREGMIYLFFGIAFLGALAIMISPGYLPEDFQGYWNFFDYYLKALLYLATAFASNLQAVWLVTKNDY